MTQKAIELKNISFTYPSSDSPTLNNINFTLNYGDFTVLSGLSGEGKSTLLSIINGAIPRITSGTLAGQVLINGNDVSSLSMSQISTSVGSVLQNADAQIINQFVEDEIALGCENLGLDISQTKERVKSSIDMMKLGANEYTKLLSGGQKQRLVAASTLAMGQKIIVLDEPLANLDLEGANILLATLHNLAQQGYAIFVIEHRLDVILPYASHLVWLENRSLRLFEKPLETFQLYKNNLACTTASHTNSTEVLIELSSLQHSFGNKNILKEISMKIHKGERIVILGENGCGKSTLLKLIARLLSASEQQISQNIIKPLHKRNEFKWFSQVGYVHQNPSYQLFMPSVYEEINFNTVSSHWTNTIIESLSLKSILDTHPHALSEGQKRKVSIGAILSLQPKLLLLDEPSVGQDYNNLCKILEFLNNLHKEYNMSIVTVTHDYQCALALADTVIWIKDGKVYKRGDRTLVHQYFNRNL